MEFIGIWFKLIQNRLNLIVFTDWLIISFWFHWIHCDLICFGTGDISAGGLIGNWWVVRAAERWRHAAAAQTADWFHAIISVSIYWNLLPEFLLFFVTWPLLSWRPPRRDWRGQRSPLSFFFLSYLCINIRGPYGNVAVESITKFMLIAFPLPFPSLPLQGRTGNPGGYETPPDVLLAVWVIWQRCLRPENLSRTANDAKESRRSYF